MWHQWQSRISHNVTIYMPIIPIVGYKSHKLMTVVVGKFSLSFANNNNWQRRGGVGNRRGRKVFLQQAENKTHRKMKNYIHILFCFGYLRLDERKFLFLFFSFWISLEINKSCTIFSSLWSEKNKKIKIQSGNFNCFIAMMKSSRVKAVQSEI